MDHFIPIMAYAVDAKLFNERSLKEFKFCVFIQSKDMAQTFEDVLLQI